jgi:magnesium transporter
MQRDLLAGTLDLYLSSVANRTNAVMKALTILGTVALPVLVVSSFYGMNLPNLPWADSPGGLTFVVLLMAGLTLALAAVLRYFRWL